MEKARNGTIVDAKVAVMHKPATAGTLFHKCKLGMLKAFEMAFRVSVRKKGMSGCELSKGKSNKGTGFPLLHMHVMNIKGWWLRGTHHKCGPQRLQNYLDGYHFRFNRRAFLNSAFDKLIGRMAEFEPVFYKMIKCDLNT